MTGATGFIGRHLVARLLNEGWQVVALVRSADHGLAGDGVSVVSGDVRDAEAVRRGSAGADVFFHLAGQASVGAADEAPAEAIQINVTGTLNAAEACRANGIRRLVHVSTMHVFGPPPAVPADNERPFNPQSAYASAKLAAERLALAQGRAAGFDVVVLRPSNVFGPGQSPPAVVAEFVALAAQERPIEAAQPDVRRSFLYVEDLIDALVCAAGDPAAGGLAFNLEAPGSLSIGELAGMIETTARSMARSPDKPAVPPVRNLPALKDWSPRISVEDGVRRTLWAKTRPQWVAGEGPAPRVSIVIPVYNGGDYLAEAIDSALCQTYPNLEVVVVNDGSSDGGATAAIAAAYGDRIRYFEKENGGVASALNVAIREMDGELFSWLSHDDLYHPTKVAAQVDAYLGFGSPCLVFCDYEHVSETLEHLFTSNLAPQRLDERPLNGLFGGVYNGCTFLIPRDVLVEMEGFREGLPTTQDYELWFRIAGRLPFVYVPQALVRQRIHPAQGSRHIGHLYESGRLMMYMVDQTPLRVMELYDGSAERFLIRVASQLAQSHYTAPGAAYASFRARQALLRHPHQIVLVLAEGALAGTLAAIARHQTRFLQQEWLIVTPEPIDGIERPPHVAMLHRAPAEIPETVTGVAALASRDLVYVASVVPSDGVLLSLVEDLVLRGAAMVEDTAPSGSAGPQGWLLRRSVHPASIPAEMAQTRVSPAFPREVEATPGGIVLPPPITAKALDRLARPLSRLVLDAGLRLCRLPPLRSLGIRFVRRALRRARLGQVLDVQWYRDTYLGGKGSSRVVWRDYLTSGWRDGRAPNGWFDPAFYVQQLDGEDRNDPPLIHYLAKGARAGLAPHPVFQLNRFEPSAYIPPPRGASLGTRRRFRDAGERQATAMLTEAFREDRPTILLVVHCWGGGTFTHTRELSSALARHANVLFLYGGAEQPFVLSPKATYPAEGLAFDTQSEIPDLVRLLRAIGIDHVDVHHAGGFEAALEPVLAGLGTAFDLTLVDYQMIATQPYLTGADGRFVGDGAPARALLRDEVVPLYRKAARRIAISRDMAQRLRTLRPEFDVVCAAHWGRPPIERREVFIPKFWWDEPLRVLVFGPMNPHKGRDILIRAAEEVTARGLPIEFHVLGDSATTARLPAVDSLFEHGWFSAATLLERLGSIAPHVAWYPAQVPETWCYALDDGMIASMPIVANALGALTERCYGRPATWMLPPDCDAATVADLLAELRRRVLDMPPVWQPVDGLPAADSFYFDAYLAPARQKWRERRGVERLP
ncbi:NAD-dependent epimerase/dehydratase family protein [Ancylobacter sp. TS-1]|uniref:NAD-dependent epimerase/dehydratase family protein n=1 Tax=Ancylobacter sp. TS-1 TaxID=1850374 RepID=UPI00139116DC|nr:NAD-dependent epimerase/dehydratase family protein [Ancylobacter sp. TS-1]